MCVIEKERVTNGEVKRAQQRRDRERKDKKGEQIMSYSLSGTSVISIKEKENHPRICFTSQICICLCVHAS